MNTDLIANGSFLGRGWSNPPTFVKGPNLVLMSEAEKNINESLMILIRTRLGERPFRSAYGTSLWREAFRPANDIPIGEIKASLSSAIKKFEPRVVLDDIEVELDTSDGICLQISILYTDIQVNHRKNFVYPFYLNEGTHLDDV